MVVAIAAVGGVGYWAALMEGWVVASVVILLGVATFLVQWYVIDTPGVEEQDRHGRA